MNAVHHVHDLIPPPFADLIREHSRIQEPFDSPVARWKEHDVPKGIIPPTFEPALLLHMGKIGTPLARPLVARHSAVKNGRSRY